MLDTFLAKGWFRMGQSVFTTHFLRFQNQFYPAVWLRYDLGTISADSMEGKLKKIEARFQTEVGPWVSSEEQEELFTLYRKHSGLSMAESLRHILMDEHAENVFQTFQVSIRDGDRLVGLGIFDAGDQSAAGISSIYHPDYKKYSLGKILMLLKMRHCIGLGLQWFYPGYAVPGYRRFDYKLRVLPEHTHFYHSPVESWIKYDPVAGLPNYIEQIIHPLVNVHQQLTAAGLPASIVYYPPFDLALVDDMLPSIITDPAFLLLSYNAETGVSTIAIYDLRQEGFSIGSCKPLFTNGWKNMGDHWICYDVMKIVEKTGALFSAEDILKIVGGL